MGLEQAGPRRRPEPQRRVLREREHAVQIAGLGEPTERGHRAGPARRRGARVVDDLDEPRPLGELARGLERGRHHPGVRIAQRRADRRLASPAGTGQKPQQPGPRHQPERVGPERSVLAGGYRLEARQRVLPGDRERLHERRDPAHHEPAQPRVAGVRQPREHRQRRRHASAASPSSRAASSAGRFIQASVADPARSYAPILVPRRSGSDRLRCGSPTSTRSVAPRGGSGREIDSQAGWWIVGRSWRWHHRPCSIRWLTDERPTQPRGASARVRVLSESPGAHARTAGATDQNHCDEVRVLAHPTPRFAPRRVSRAPARRRRSARRRPPRSWSAAGARGRACAAGSTGSSG